jgi:hypothetical protein
MRNKKQKLALRLARIKSKQCKKRLAIKKRAIGYYQLNKEMVESIKIDY